MPIRWQDFTHSRSSVALGLTISKVPTPIGYPIAEWCADRISERKHDNMVKATRANQWVIHSETPSARELDVLVQKTYRSTARSLYEFWHYFNKPNRVLDMVDLDPSFTEMIAQSRREHRGTLLVAPHLSNFDLISRAVVLKGYYMQILSYPQPPGGYRWQNELRQLPGLTVTPISIEALRQASDTLRDGGIVVTGIDRPLPDEKSKYLVRFFGRLASLPVFHIRLALKHDLPIFIMGGCRNESGRYCLWASPPIRMVKSADLVQEIVENAEAALAILERYILRNPEQWAMFYPVWPQALDQMPE